MTHHLAITLTDEQKAELERIADAREETLVATVQEAVAQFLDKAEEYRKYVQEGIDAAREGRTTPWEEVKTELRARYGDLDG
jgi:predicted transcriptional regulator